MFCYYYLRDKQITIEVVERLIELCEKTKEEVANILPMGNELVIEECRQNEPKYEYEKFFFGLITDFKFGVLEEYGFRFLKFMNKKDFIEFYKENEGKYSIINQYFQYFTLEEFLKKIENNE